MEKVVEIIKQGGVVVYPTDTLYGLLGNALDSRVVEKIYKIKGREENKPFIILISNIDELKLFGVDIDDMSKVFLNNYWPGELSVILPVGVKSQKQMEYLHRGGNTLAFRLPKSERISGLLKQTGPLVAPSVNPAGQKPAETIDEAKKYFFDEIDFYEDVGPLNSAPSTLVSINGGDIKVLRQGNVKIDL